MKRVFSYPVTLTPDRVDGGYVAAFIDFPEVVTQGETKAEALHQAVDALEEALAGRIKRGDEIPYPSLAKEKQATVSPSAFISSKVALYVAMRDSKLTRMTLAERLGCDEKEVRRLLDPKHPSKLPRLSAALAVLGKRLTVNLEDVR